MAVEGCGADGSDAAAPEAVWAKGAAARAGQGAGSARSPEVELRRGRPNASSLRCLASGCVDDTLNGPRQVAIGLAGIRLSQVSQLPRNGVEAVSKRGKRRQVIEVLGDQLR